MGGITRLRPHLLPVCKQVLSLRKIYTMARFLVPSFVCLRISWSLGGKPRLGGIGQGAHHLIHHSFKGVQALGS